MPSVNPLCKNTLSFHSKIIKFWYCGDLPHSLSSQKKKNYMISKVKRDGQMELFRSISLQDFRPPFMSWMPSFQPTYVLFLSPDSILISSPAHPAHCLAATAPPVKNSFGHSSTTSSGSLRRLPVLRTGRARKSTLSLYMF
jgi:hypothetical protein